MPPDLSQSLLLLAMLLDHRGQPDEARRLIERAMAITEGDATASKTNLTGVLLALAQFEASQGRVPEALAALARTEAQTDARLLQVFLTGSERRKLAFLDGTKVLTDFTLGLHLVLMPDDPQAARAAFQTILRHKGLALDAQAQTLAHLRQHLDDQGLSELATLADLREQQARLLNETETSRQEQRQQQEELAQAIEARERALAQHLDVSSIFQLDVDMETVAAALPGDAALVEWVQFRPLDPREISPDRVWGAPRYAAYVLRPDGSFSWADVGEVADIDAEVARLRASVMSRAPVSDQARSLYDRLLGAVLPLCGGAEHLLVSPDGQLSLLPFELLQDPQGRPLLESHAVTLLSTGRELLRERSATAARSSMLIVADPDYGAAPTSGSVAAKRWAPLKGTRAEARAIAALYPDARQLTDDEASERAVKQAAGPAILHVATHGFYLGPAPVALEEARMAMTGARGVVALSAPQDITSPAVGYAGNPLFRSGLVLAGANAGGDGVDDGYLTAAEVTGLDLRGTRLVVLSACETGLGQVQSGQGVLGLRRALALAGSDAQVISLWQVDDEATSQLMASFYRLLAAGVGRTEALRRAKTEIRQDPRWHHPWYWAGFVSSGAWEPIPQP